MFNSEKQNRRFHEIVNRIKPNLNSDEDKDFCGNNLNLTFHKLLVELRNYNLEVDTYVELVDLLLFDEKNGEKSTISRLRQKYEGYSDFMLGTYMKIGLEPNDQLLQNLVEFDLDHGFTVDQLVKSGWFYYRKWSLIHGLEKVILQSIKTSDIMQKVVMRTSNP